MTTGNFWPFSAKTAWFTSLLLVPLLFGLAALLRWVGILFEDRISPLVALIVVALGVIPVLALILERVTSVKAAGVEVSFAAVQTAVQSAGAAAKIKISGNLGTPPGSPIMDSSGGSILQAVKAGTASQVVVVDLGDGQQWWQSRLLLLASGMSRHRPGSAIVFTALLGEQPDRFVGWAPSAAVVKCLLASDEALRRAYLSALRDTNLAGLGTPADWDHPERGLESPVAVADGKKLPTPFKFDDFIGERMLFGRLLELEGGHLGGGVEVTAFSVKTELFPSVLHTDSLAEEVSQADQLRTLLRAEDDYLAVTDRGRYVNLLSHRVVVSGVLRSLAASEVTG
jgi:hypothetical protein